MSVSGVKRLTGRHVWLNITVTAIKCEVNITGNTEFPSLPLQEVYSHFVIITLHVLKKLAYNSSIGHNGIVPSKETDT